MVQPWTTWSKVGPMLPGVVQGGPFWGGLDWSKASFGGSRAGPRWTYVRKVSPAAPIFRGGQPPRPPTARIAISPAVAGRARARARARAPVVNSSGISQLRCSPGSRGGWAARQFGERASSLGVIDVHFGAQTRVGTPWRGARWCAPNTWNSPTPVHSDCCWVAAARSSPRVALTRLMHARAPWWAC